jgi:hypothetical protein
MSQKPHDIIGGNFSLSSFELPLSKRTELDGNKKKKMPATFLDITPVTIAPHSVILGIYER